MMVRVDDSGDRTKCWLSREEVDRLEQAAGRVDWERELAIALMGRVGLRAHEVTYPGDEHLRWSDKGDCWFLEVRGKNTKGGERTVRDAWVPERVQRDVRRFSRERGRASDEPWISVSTPSVRRWVSEAAQAVAEGGGSDRWRQVSSHDLRRSWATHYLVNEGWDVRTMMAIGGWSDYSAIEPYLNEPTEQRIGDVVNG